ncbi:MAG TPA: sulfatase-like hydrolase/transferase, partial [Prosthecobacter sp.]|nr:sulfatase-like hydrolase/transferase [Prosthecobacter sp.]
MRSLLLISSSFLVLVSSFAAEQRPNILFVLSDDHSYPFLGCYGRKEMKTPSLDRIAAEGMMFRRMFTGAPQCVPSR